MKGRTLQSLIKQSDIWHKRLSFVGQNVFWRPSGIGGYRVEKKKEVVQLQELTESHELAIEGRQMKHCVASYTHCCAKGRSAIFSLRKYSEGLLLETMATIEVNLSMKMIVQAKAKMNRGITEEAKKYMMAWASKELLSVSQYL